MLKKLKEHISYKEEGLDVKIGNIIVIIALLTLITLKMSDKINLSWWIIIAPVLVPHLIAINLVTWRKE